MVVLSEISKRPSTSSSTHDHKYDVFLSFRGLDTRLNFTDHLYNSLINANITTFLDDEEIETGEDLKPELEKSIKESRASIIVLSENYASSTWCLDELVLILHQHRTSGHIVIPIFFHVQPTDVRKQQSSFGIAMEKHKQKMEKETNVAKRSRWAQKMEIWKKALTEVSNLKGKDAKGRKETEFIEEIVTDIHHRLGVPLRVTLPLLIGMENDIEFITSWLKDGSASTADILTILGMGGIGKTSLAKYVFGLHCHEFPRSNFVEDISRRCIAQFNGLLDLQKQICGDISKTSSSQIYDVSVYTSKIEDALARKKVFLVLDGVDSLDHLDALLGKKGFHPGSKIIITTRDASLTKGYVPFHSKVQPRHTKHLLEGLHMTKSLELLCFHAFKCNGPDKGYEEVSSKLVKYCEGHPLALEVLGKSLRNRDVAEWEDYIERLKEETDSRVTKVLQMSFDSLPSKNDKELFKHIACFFVGKDREFVETILKACGIHIVLGIQNLIDRCLLRIGRDNELMMHQLIQEMGRDVVRQESLDKPWKRSRLWCHEESFKVLKQKKGKGNILGLMLDMRMLEKDKLHGSYELKTAALSKMDNLKLLQLNYVQLNGSYKNFPQELRWLCMHGFPSESIPSDLAMANLVGLDMSYSNLKSFDMSCINSQQPGKRKKLLSGWCLEETRLLRSLKILNLSFCKQLRSVGGFFELPALERLILADCLGLTEVCESIEQCDELVFIDLRCCNMLRKVPRTMVKLKKVETLLLDGCNLDEFLNEMRDIDIPKMVKAYNNGINSQASFSAIPIALKSSPIGFRSSLVRLSLENCKLSTESFPMDFSFLSKLKDLNISRNPIVSMPNCVRSLPMLEILSMRDCNILKTVMHPPRTLRKLDILSDTFVPDSIEKIVFDREMSPLNLQLAKPSLEGPLQVEFEGLIKVEAMADIAEEVLHSLGWSNLEFIKNQKLETRDWMEQTHESEVQMVYEYGIFSTMYVGQEIPHWISHRSKGSSISFTMPSSPNNLNLNLRGLNICYVLMDPCRHPSFYPVYIRVSNITRNRTWIYHCHTKWCTPIQDSLISLSHWMFGKNEMEDGDQVTITVVNEYLLDIDTSECGISLVYDDGKMEKDPLAYYKSWNHIIGGDLSPFLTTTGEYLLQITRFCRGWLFMGPMEPIPYAEMYPKFKAFSQRKFNGTCT